MNGMQSGEYATPDSRPARGAGLSEAGRCPRAGEAGWRSIVLRIRAGDPGGAEDFARTYSSGIRLLFRRQLGEVGLNRLVEEAVRGAVEEIRQGLIDDPSHLVTFVRTVLSYTKEELNDRAARAPVAPAEPAAPARQRLMDITKRLRRLSPAERRVLARYYLHDHDIDSILYEEGISLEEFERLRASVANSSPSGAPARHLPPQSAQLFSRATAQSA